MIATKVHTVYSILMPAEVRALLAQLSFVVTLGVGGVATTPLECLGLSGYVPRLLFYMVFPIVVTVVLLGGVCVSMLLKKKEKKKARDSSAAAQHKSSAVEDHGNRFNIEEEVDRTEVGSTLIENVLPPFLQIMFLLYPLVTNVAFEGFPSYTFADGRAFLIADVSIESGTSDAAFSTMLAWIAVLIYPVGLMAVNLLLLVLARGAIIDNKPTPLSRSIAFLYREYDVRIGGLENMRAPAASRA